MMDDLTFLKKPIEWPLWPFVPMKRAMPINKETPFPTCAVVCDDMLPRPDGSMGLLIAEGFNYYSLASSKQEVKDGDWKKTTAEEVLQNGWYVD